MSTSHDMTQLINVTYVSEYQHDISLKKRGHTIHQAQRP